MMTTLPQQPLLDSLREALDSLESDPGPMTPEKAELISYLGERILANQVPARAATRRMQTNPA